LPYRRVASELCQHGKPWTVDAASAKNCWVLTVISIISWVLPSRRIDETPVGRKSPNENLTIFREIGPEKLRLKLGVDLHAFRELVHHGVRRSVLTAALAASRSSVSSPGSS
jgi:hypothetical protein